MKRGEVTPAGVKEVKEAVLIAALVAVATGLVNWGVEEGKRVLKERRDRKPGDQKQRPPDEKKAEP